MSRRRICDGDYGVAAAAAADNSKNNDDWFELL